MPRINNLTDEGRQKAAAKTNRIIAERRAKRQEKVKVLLDEGLPKNEIAKRLDVRPETISRDIRALKQKENYESLPHHWYPREPSSATSTRSKANRSKTNFDGRKRGSGGSPLRCAQSEHQLDSIIFNL